MEENKRLSIDTVCAALCVAMGIEPPKEAAKANPYLVAYLQEKLGGEKVDRIVMYNPDAVAQWIMEKYPVTFRHVTDRAELALPLETVMPSVTPVCFGSLYTGAQPAVHGIRKYEKPVIRIDTLFDALIRAGKKPCIISHGNASMNLIFRERDMDYFWYEDYPEANAKAAEILLEDKYDFVAIYNGNYDKLMHRYAPESVEALGEGAANAAAFGAFHDLIQSHWKNHRTLLGFAMDHGCHEIDGNLGSHGLDMEEDLHIRHYYKII